MSLLRIKLAASNFARWFIGVLGRESHILGNFAPTEAKNRTNRPAHGPHLHLAIYRNSADVGSAYADIRPSLKTEVLASLLVKLTITRDAIYPV